MFVFGACCASRSEGSERSSGMAGGLGAKWMTVRRTDDGENPTAMRRPRRRESNDSKRAPII